MTPSDIVERVGWTPGPWTLTHKRGSNFAVQEFAIRGMFGDKPNVYPIFNKDTSAIDGTTVFTSPENARLIAAAPCLFEALTQIVEYRDEGGNDEGDIDCLISQARTALSKATGANP